MESVHFCSCEIKVYYYELELKVWSYVLKKCFALNLAVLYLHIFLHCTPDLLKCIYKILR